MLPISRFIIKGHSMRPTFNEGEKVWLNRWSFLFNSPKKNDVVVFTHNNKFLMKRVSNVSKDRYFLSGDNKTNSLDSSSFGPIDKNKILGKVIKKY